MTRVEICVETPQGIAAANAAGADRIELCASLDVGGLTPSAGLMRQAARGHVATLAMIRPRGGSFVFDHDEAAVMVDDIRTARDCGLTGVVLGAIRPDGDLDHDLLLRLSGHCAGMERTLHRVFDLVRDPSAELEFAVRAGFTRILTSGQRPTAPQGQECLAPRPAPAAGRGRGLGGGGGAPRQGGARVRAPGGGEVHASCRQHVLPSAGGDGAFGFGPMPGRTDPDAIRALMIAAQGVS